MSIWENTDEKWKQTTDVDRENSDNLYNIRENADNLLSLKVLHANILEEYIIFIHLPFFLIFVLGPVPLFFHLYSLISPILSFR